MTTARDGVNKGLASSASEGFLDIASACSGSEIGYICLEVLLFFLCSILGMQARARHVFCCEKDEDKQRFIKSQLKPLHMFGEVGELGQSMARCVLKGISVQVPWSFAFMAGFRARAEARRTTRPHRTSTASSGKTHQQSPVTLGRQLTPTLQRLCPL